MNKKIVVLSAVLILALAMIYSCRKDVGKPATVAAPPPPPGACDTITYAKHIQPIIQSMCATNAGCHANGAIQTNLTSYDAVKGIAVNGSLKGYVIDASPELMPKGGPKLPQNQLDLIQCWINNGEKQ